MVHQVSCPYTPEQTGIVERRHRIIRELGMTMLFHSNAPLFLWVEAFSTAVYLMIRLPSSAINFETPYFKLHGIRPVYSLLRILALNVFLTHGILVAINLIQKLLHVFLWAIVINIKDISAFIF